MGITNFSYNTTQMFRTCKKRSLLPFLPLTHLAALTHRVEGDCKENKKKKLGIVNKVG